jgi:hypothetical protein
MTEHSAEEVEADRLSTLGPTLGPFFHALDNEITWLHAIWQQYRHLYAVPETVELLNETAAFFFHMNQEMMLRDVILNIARLTDRPESMGKANLTLRRLAATIEEAAGPRPEPGQPDSRNPRILAVADRVTVLVDQALERSAFSRDWRNRNLAHKDLALALGKGAAPLDPVSREMIGQALAAMAAVMNEVNAHYWSGLHTMYEAFIAHNDAEALTYHLSEAIELERKRRAPLAELG